MTHETTFDGWDQWRITHTRRCAKSLLTDGRYEGIHTRWCTKQLLMDETNEGLPIRHGVKTAVDGLDTYRNPYKMMHEPTVDGRYQRRITYTRWCTKQLLMNEGWRNPHQMMFETTADGWDQRMTTHARWCVKQLLIYETDDGPIPDDARNNCWRMRPTKDDPYRMAYETTVDGQEIWSNPYQMMHETSVDGWDKWRNTHARWCTKQMLMDERGDWIHTWWCAKELLMDETNYGLPIQDGVQFNGQCMREMKKSIPDEAQNCWWMRPMKDYPYQMVYKTTVDGRDRWKNT